MYVLLILIPTVIWHIQVIILCLICWLIAPVFMFPLLLEHGGKRAATWNTEQFIWYVLLFDVQPVSSYVFSTFIPSRMSNNWKTYMLFCRILFQFMPAILMTSFYTTIFLKVRQQERLMQRYTYKQKVTCQHRLTWLKTEKKRLIWSTKKIIINNTNTRF